MTEKKQIEEMAKVICKSYAEKKDCETCPTPWCYAEEYATLLYCAGYRKQEWISVDERLPEDGMKRVAVFLQDNQLTTTIGINRIDTDRYLDGKWVRWGKWITHWMPLPEPPKGE